MIIPIQELSAETLRNIAESFVLREGTDYGDVEMSFDDKVEQVLANLRSARGVSPGLRRTQTAQRCRVRGWSRSSSPRSQGVGGQFGGSVDPVCYLPPVP